MTCRVIDTTPVGRLAGHMTPTRAPEESRFDRTLRTVMWLDAFLSVGLVAVGLLACPLLATVGVPAGLRFALGLGVIVCAVLLAAFGAITAVIIMMRMRAGQYLLPIGLRLPLPRPMRPSLSTSKPRPSHGRRGVVLFSPCAPRASGTQTKELMLWGRRATRTGQHRADRCWLPCARAGGSACAQHGPDLPPARGHVGRSDRVDDRRRRVGRPGLHRRHQAKDTAGKAHTKPSYLSRSAR